MGKYYTKDTYNRYRWIIWISFIILLLWVLYACPKYDNFFSPFNGYFTKIKTDDILGTHHVIEKKNNKPFYGIIQYPNTDIINKLEKMRGKPIPLNDINENSTTYYLSGKSSLLSF